jgi:hypothetical protein
MKRRHTIEAQNQKLRLALHAFSWRENGLFNSHRTISVKKTEETHAVLSSSEILENRIVTEKKTETGKWRAA